ncbi:hypothetical protein T10_13193 [Trichinella papuae]|uniref:Uncharacterized protein n=1 Tax=Trichinella papuae TaxID=268474 RepID=A0A0V1LWD9_9BILA|nr:hypothetical protein T10_13193 [Trichinella papuae]
MPPTDLLFCTEHRQAIDTSLPPHLSHRGPPVAVIGEKKKWSSLSIMKKNGTRRLRVEGSSLL